MNRRTFLTWAVVLGTGLSLASAEVKTKIALIGKDRDHPPRTHEYLAECNLLATCLKQTPGVETVVSNGWPTDPAVLEDVNAIVMYNAMGGNVLLHESHRAQALALLKKGVGFTAIHWATGADAGEIGELYLKVLGGWFNHEAFSRLLTKPLKVRGDNPKHPVCRGWKDYMLRDEYYLDLKYMPQAKPVMLVTDDKGKDQAVGWVYERPDANGGRSFGTVLGHFHENFGMEPFRTALVNGILWTAHRRIPTAGAPCKITDNDMKLPPDPRAKKYGPRQRTNSPSSFSRRACAARPS